MTRRYEIAVTADARQVTAADFLKAFAPKRGRVEELCAELWNASPERVREIHEELRAFKDNWTVRVEVVSDKHSRLAA